MVVTEQGIASAPAAAPVRTVNPTVLATRNWFVRPREWTPMVRTTVKRWVERTKPTTVQLAVCPSVRTLPIECGTTKARNFSVMEPVQATLRAVVTAVRGEAVRAAQVELRFHTTDSGVRAAAAGQTTTPSVTVLRIGSTVTMVC